MILSPNWCVLCKKDEEQTNHLFIHYPFASEVWYYFISKSNVSWVMPKDMVDLFFSWKIPGYGKRAKKNLELYYSCYFVGNLEGEKGKINP